MVLSVPILRYFRVCLINCILVNEYTYRGSNSTILPLFSVEVNSYVENLLQPSKPAGLLQSGKNIWKMNFFPGQGKCREFYGWSGKFTKEVESQGKVGEFESKRLWQADLRKFIYSNEEGKGCSFS